MEALSGHEEFYEGFFKIFNFAICFYFLNVNFQFHDIFLFDEGCTVEPFPASLNETLGWAWPGNYPYAAMDTAFYAFMGCLKTLYIGVSSSISLLSLKWIFI